MSLFRIAIAAFRRIPPETLILAWPAAVVAWRTTLSVDVFSLSEDDFARTLDAWAVSRGTVFPTDVWPPGPAWAAGALMRLGIPLEASPTVINLGAITLALVLTSDIARQLGVPGPLRLAAVASATLPRWPAWLGLSGLAEPPAALAFVALAHGAVRINSPHYRGARTEILLASAVAALSRYEAWILAPIAVGLLLRHRPDRRARWLFVAVLPLFVPVVWVSLQLVWNGNLEFAVLARSTLQTTNWRPEGESYYIGLIQDFLDACGPLLPLGILGGWLSRRERTTQLLVLIWTGTAMAYLAAGCVGFGGVHNPPRIWLGHALLLPVGIALAFRAAQLRTAWVSALVIGVALVCLPSWIPTPTGYDPDTEVIADRTREELLATPGSMVVVEAVPWACLPMKALIGDPGRVIWDREPDGEPLSTRHPSLLGGDVRVVATMLAARNVQFVVTGDDETLVNMKLLGQPIANAGAWILWELSPRGDTEKDRILREIERSTQPR